MDACQWEGVQRGRSLHGSEWARVTFPLVRDALMRGKVDGVSPASPILHKNMVLP